MFRIVFADVCTRPMKVKTARARIGFGGILSRAKALARAPELANVRRPANVPPPKNLAMMPTNEKPSTGSMPIPDDDIPFAPNEV